MREKRWLTVAKQPLLARNVKTRFKELLIGQISYRIFIIPERFVFRPFLFLSKYLIPYFRDGCHNYIKFYHLKLISGCH